MDRIDKESSDLADEKIVVVVEKASPPCRKERETTAVVVEPVDPVGNLERSGKLSTSPQAGWTTISSPWFSPAQLSPVQPTAADDGLPLRPGR